MKPDSCQSRQTRGEYSKKGVVLTTPFTTFGRDEATRTPDPYVPNVVRYQLRYIPLANDS